MKTKTSLERSAKAALKHSISSSSIVNGLLNLIREGHHPDEVTPGLRNELAQLTKSVHEFNAYHNALTTV